MLRFGRGIALEAALGERPSGGGTGGDGTGEDKGTLVYGTRGTDKLCCQVGDV